MRYSGYWVDALNDVESAIRGLISDGVDADEEHQVSAIHHLYQARNALRVAVQNNRLSDCD